MDTSRDRLLVKICLREQDDDPALGLIDSVTITAIRNLSERKLASRDCSLRRAVLIQKALPLLDTPSSPPPAHIAAEEHPWDRDPPCFDAPQSEGITLPSLGDDELDVAAAFGGPDAPLLFHSLGERDHEWYDHQHCTLDLGEPLFSEASSLSASMEDDDEPQPIVTASEQPEIALPTRADSDEEEEEVVVRELFRKFSGSAASPRSARKIATALGKRGRGRSGDTEDGALQAEDEEDSELMSHYSVAAQAEPLKCCKPSRSASPCGLTRRASVSSPASSQCAVFPVLTLG